MKIHKNYEEFLNEALSPEKLQHFITSFCLMYSDLDESSALKAITSLDEHELTTISNLAKEMEKSHESGFDLSSGEIEEIETILTAKGALQTKK